MNRQPAQPRRVINGTSTGATPPGFVDLLKANYQAWIAGLAGQTGCEHRVLQTGQYLADVLHPLGPPA